MFNKYIQIFQKPHNIFDRILLTNLNLFCLALGLTGVNLLLFHDSYSLSVIFFVISAGLSFALNIIPSPLFAQNLWYRTDYVERRHNKYLCAFRDGIYFLGIPVILAYIVINSDFDFFFYAPILFLLGFFLSLLNNFLINKYPPVDPYLIELKEKERQEQWEERVRKRKEITDALASKKWDLIGLNHVLIFVREQGVAYSERLIEEQYKVNELLQECIKNKDDECSEYPEIPLMEARLSVLEEIVDSLNTKAEELEARKQLLKDEIECLVIQM